MLREMAGDLARIEGLTVNVVAVGNTLFGGAVTIAGLISGQDIVDALSDGPPCDRLILPRSMFDTAAGLRTIDGWTVDDIARRLEIEVVIGEGPRDLLTKTVAGGDPKPPTSGARVQSGATEELICAGS
jgi:NifB/MoaA-like Fe-S oxidoreductase